MVLRSWLPNSCSGHCGPQLRDLVQTPDGFATCCYAVLLAHSWCRLLLALLLAMCHTVSIVSPVRLTMSCSVLLCSGCIEGLVPLWSVSANTFENLVAVML